LRYCCPIAAMNVMMQKLEETLVLMNAHFNEMDDYYTDYKAKLTAKKIYLETMLNQLETECRILESECQDAADYEYEEYKQGELFEKCREEYENIMATIFNYK
jgi:phage gp36-like protein